MNSEGHKFDAGKPRFDLLPPDALRAMATVMAMGAEKYGDRNWELGMDWSRCYAAAMRHITSWWEGEDLDPESGLSHIHHAMVNLIFLTSYEIRKKGTDNRPEPLAPLESTL